MAQSAPGTRARKPLRFKIGVAEACGLVGAAGVGNEVVRKAKSLVFRLREQGIAYQRAIEQYDRYLADCCTANLTSADLKQIAASLEKAGLRSLGRAG
ncbi:hypothetical protein [Amycolatopsis sp. GA6-003]|uniref:hypothetical protein n=1 Tax=Amycolatopsis sp. GA6-003 TaxID=2652444 RepID=UPI0039170FFC